MQPQCINGDQQYTYMLELEAFFCEMYADENYFVDFSPEILQVMVVYTITTNNKIYQAFITLGASP